MRQKKRRNRYIIQRDNTRGTRVIYGAWVDINNQWVIDQITVTNARGISSLSLLPIHLIKKQATAEIRTRKRQVPLPEKKMLRSSSVDNMHCSHGGGKAEIAGSIFLGCLGQHPKWISLTSLVSFQILHVQEQHTQPSLLSFQKPRKKKNSAPSASLLPIRVEIIQLVCFQILLFCKGKNIMAI